jgi:hypothetical protein
VKTALCRFRGTLPILHGPSEKIFVLAHYTSGLKSSSLEKLFRPVVKRLNLDMTTTKTTPDSDLLRLSHEIRSRSVELRTKARELSDAAQRARATALNVAMRVVPLLVCKK